MHHREELKHYLELPRYTYFPLHPQDHWISATAQTVILGSKDHHTHQLVVAAMALAQSGFGSPVQSELGIIHGVIPNRLWLRVDERLTAPKMQFTTSCMQFTAPKMQCLLHPGRRYPGGLRFCPLHGSEQLLKGYTQVLIDDDLVKPVMVEKLDAPCHTDDVVEFVVLRWKRKNKLLLLYYTSLIIFVMNIKILQRKNKEIIINC